MALKDDAMQFAKDHQDEAQGAFDKLRNRNKDKDAQQPQEGQQDQNSDQAA